MLFLLSPPLFAFARSIVSENLYIFFLWTQKAQDTLVYILEILPVKTERPHFVGARKRGSNSMYLA